MPATIWRTGSRSTRLLSWRRRNWKSVPVSRAVEVGYAPDLTESELEKLGADPFIVAYGVALPEQVTVVTMERSRPKRQRANRHIPDVCADLEVPCIDTYELLRRLDFRTDWRER